MLHALWIGMEQFLHFKQTNRSPYMYRLILVSLWLLTAWPVANGCDACGCSIMGQPSGLLSQYRKSYLSMGYSRSGFTSAPGIGEGSSDAFHTLDLTFQYYFSSRFHAGLYQPYRINTRNGGQGQQEVHGFSDTRLQGSYTFFQATKPKSKFVVYLDAGIGLSLPTGKYDPHLHDQNLPENFNPGNGSLGYSLSQTSSLSYGSIGLVIKNNWTQFTGTPAGYQYGDQWVANLLTFIELPIDTQFSVLPMAGFQFENVASDHYANGNNVHGTGGQGTYFSAGGQLKFKTWLCTFQYVLPMSGTYSDGEVQPDQRLSLQLTHLF